MQPCMTGPLNECSGHSRVVLTSAYARSMPSISINCTKNHLRLKLYLIRLTLVPHTAHFIARVLLHCDIIHSHLLNLTKLLKLCLCCQPPEFFSIFILPRTRSLQQPQSQNGFPFNYHPRSRHTRRYSRPF